MNVEQTWVTYLATTIQFGSWGIGILSRLAKIDSVVLLFAVKN